MPNACRLAESGVRFLDHHAAYPSHTRVNVATLSTGVGPGRHGIVANAMLVAGATADHRVDTGNHEHIDALDRHTGGRALLVPGLAELLAERGESVAVAGTGSPGSNLLWSRRDRRKVLNTNADYGVPEVVEAHRRLGGVPPVEPGAYVRRPRYAAQAAIQMHLPDPLNRVVVLWLSEPDHAQHGFGLSSPEALDGMRAVDACLGEVLAALDRLGLRDTFDVLFLSEHGHSTVTAQRSLAAHVNEALAETGQALALAVASDYVYAAPGAPVPGSDELAPIVAWLRAQPWVGAVLAARDDVSTLPGVLPLRRVWGGATNDRAPLLAVSAHWSDDPNEAGIRGTTSVLDAKATLRSTHGSLSPYDMHATLLAAGPSFRDGWESDLPTGAIDVMPTLLTLLGLPLPDHLEGRVLWEALRTPGNAPDAAREEAVEPSSLARDGREVVLHLRHVGESCYVHAVAQRHQPIPQIFSRAPRVPAR